MASPTFSSPPASSLPLGQKTEYRSEYDPSLLYPIKRGDQRASLGITTDLPFHGFDIWNCYEVSWLNLKGKPEVRIVELFIPCESINIIESKSLKLYLNSFNNSKFSNQEEVYNLISTDLNKAAGIEIIVKILPLHAYISHRLSSFTGASLDELDIECNALSPTAEILSCDVNNIVEEQLYSDLFKSNCLVTNQPDWASILISYKGPKIDHEGLLRYFVAYRNHNEFHEHCCERVFTDILKKCNPSELTIYTRYTRRGGIDINSIRSTTKLEAGQINNERFVRQ